MSKSEGLSRLSKFIYRLTVIFCVCLMLFVLYVYAMADKISDVNNVATLLLSITAVVYFVGRGIAWIIDGFAAR